MSLEQLASVSSPDAVSRGYQASTREAHLSAIGQGPTLRMAADRGGCPGGGPGPPDGRPVPHPPPRSGHDGADAASPPPHPPPRPRPPPPRSTAPTARP